MKNWGGAYKLLNATGAIGSQGGCCMVTRLARPVHPANAQLDAVVVVTVDPCPAPSVS